MISNHFLSLFKQRIVMFNIVKRLIHISNCNPNREVGLIKSERLFLESRKNRQLLLDINDYKELWKNCSNVEIEDIKLQINEIINLYDYINNTTFRVPSNINTTSMKKLINIDDKKQRKMFLNKLYDYELIKWKNKNVDKEITKERLNEKYNQMHTSSSIGIFNDNNQIIYGLWHNCLFTRIRRIDFKKIISRVNLNHVSLFGPKLIIDFENDSDNYYDKIDKLENMVTNDFYNFGFDMTFCNLPKEFNNMSISNNFIKLTSQSYLQLFKNNYSNLIYINQNSYDILTDQDYNHDNIYVLRINNNINQQIRPTIYCPQMKIRRIPFSKYYENLDDNINFKFQIKVLSEYYRNQNIEKSIFHIVENNNLNKNHNKIVNNFSNNKKMYYEKFKRKNKIFIE